jgi:hypothetical protein
MKKHLYLLTLLLVITGIAPLQAQTQELDRLKAIFILNFIRYSDHQAANGSSEFVVGVFKDSGIQKELVKICGNSYHGKQVVIREINNFSTPVHLLFVPESYQSTYLDHVRKHGDLSNTMVVSDKNSEKTTINFEINDSRLCFRLNEPMLESNGIKIASSIKSLAVNYRN